MEEILEKETRGSVNSRDYTARVDDIELHQLRDWVVDIHLLRDLKDTVADTNIVDHRSDYQHRSFAAAAVDLLEPVSSTLLTTYRVIQMFARY